MGFESFDFFHGVIVEDSNLEIVTACQNPVFGTQKFHGSDGEGGGLECSNTCLGGGEGTLLA